MQIKKLLKIKKFLPIILGLLLFFINIGPILADADSPLPLEGEWNFFDIADHSETPEGVEGAEDEGTKYIAGLILFAYEIGKNTLGFAALFLGALAAIKFIQARGNEEKITSSKNWFIWASVGMIIFSIADPIKDIFIVAGDDNFIQAGNVYKSAQGLMQQFDLILKFGRFLLGGFATYFIVVSGTKLVFFANDEETIQKQKKVFSWGIIGLMLFMLAPELVAIFYGQYSPEGASGIGPSAETANDTMYALSNFLLYFMGPLSLLALAGASIMYVAPTGEETKEKAKKIIIAVVTAILLAYSSWVIVNEIVRATS